MIVDEVNALRTGAGVWIRSELFTMRLTGPDRERYLNGMLSNDVALLKPGQGQWAIKASQKGRVQGILRVRRTEDAFLLDVREVVGNQVAGELVKLIIMDDCSLADETPNRDVISVVGPNARRVIEQVGYSGLDALSDLDSGGQGDVTMVRDDWLKLPGYELHVPAHTKDATVTALVEAGATSVSTEAVDAIRVEAGVPIEGRDIDDDVIPLEARLDYLLNFDKGCYIGQEVIARAHNLGGVKHILVGLEVSKDVGAGAELYAVGEDKKTGDVTSVVHSPTLDKKIALGFVRTVHQAAGTALEARENGQTHAVTVADLPFVK